VKYTLLLLMACISLCMDAQTNCKCDPPRKKTTTTTSTRIRVSVSTATAAPRHTMSAGDQAFFDELALQRDEWVADRAEERADKRRTDMVKRIISEVKETEYLRTAANPPTMLPVTVYDKPSPPLTEAPVVYKYVPVVLVHNAARNSASTTTYTDRNGQVKTVTTNTRRY
jgi:hypothetical protein